MIDYEKLKIAEKLILKVNGYYLKIIISKAYSIEYCLESASDSDDYDYENIDDLILKLKELVEPNLKYKEAWFVDNNNSAVLTNVVNGEGYMACDLTDLRAFGKTIYPDLDSLVTAQKEYWDGLLSKPQCEHESNGDVYFSFPKKGWFK